MSIKISQHINGRTRFNVFGAKGFVAIRKYKSRGYGLEKQRTFTQLHLGKISLAFDRRKRHTHNFAG
jgi:hypothetical protein